MNLNDCDERQKASRSTKPMIAKKSTITIAGIRL